MARAFREHEPQVGALGAETILIPEGEGHVRRSSCGRGPAPLLQRRWYRRRDWHQPGGRAPRPLVVSDEAVVAAGKR